MNDTPRSSKGKLRVSQAAFSGWYVHLPLVVGIISGLAGQRWVPELVGLKVTLLTRLMSGFVVGAVVATLTWTVLAVATGKMRKTDN